MIIEVSRKNMNSGNGLEKQVVWILGAVLGLLLFGMIVYAALKQNEQPAQPVIEINAAVQP